MNIFFKTILKRYYIYLFLLVFSLKVFFENSNLLIFINMQPGGSPYHTVVPADNTFEGWSLGKNYEKSLFFSCNSN